MKQIYTLLLVTFIFTLTSKSHAQQKAVYSSTTQGTIGGVPFTLSNFNTPTIESNDFSDSNFSAAPLGSNEQSITFRAHSNWGITFDSPVSNLRLYVRGWRTSEVSFSHPFTILSGTITTTTPEILETHTAVSNGIIEFTRPVTTLTATRNEFFTDNNFQSMTFALPASLSTDGFDLDNRSIKIYPNPSSDILTITNLESKKPYRIYNVLGAEVKSGFISNNAFIDIRDLTKGLYILKLDDGNAMKFAKE